jgi:hypothetical protein
MHSRLLPLSLVSCLLLVLACGPSLPTGTEKVDLTPGGLSATMEAPTGAKVNKLVLQNAVEIEWSDVAATVKVVPVTITTPPLGCPSYDKDCKVLESDATSVLYSTLYQRRPRHLAEVARELGSSKYRCSVSAREVDNARRLAAACKTLAGTGPALPIGVATVTSAPLVVLEEVSFKEKTASGEVKLSLRAPKGWETQPMPGGGRIILDPAARSAPADAITIRISPTTSVKSLAQAEGEVKRADSAGLDTIAEKKAIGGNAYSISTAPRGKGQIMTINVIANGKKQAMWAQCYGPTRRRATLEDVCSSLKVD